MSDLILKIILENDINAIQSNLEKHIFSPNTKISDLDTYFSFSLKNSNLDTIKKLYDYGANYNDQTIFDINTLPQIKMACSNKNNEYEFIVEFVLTTSKLLMPKIIIDEETTLQNIPQNILNDALIYAGNIGFLLAVKLFIDWGANSTLALQYFLTDDFYLKKLIEFGANSYEFVMTTEITELPQYLLDDAINLCVTGDKVKDKISFGELIKKGASPIKTLFYFFDDEEYVKQIISAGGDLLSDPGMIEFFLSKKQKHPLLYAMLPSKRNESHIAVSSNDITKVKELADKKKLKDFAYPLLDPLLLLATRYADINMVKLLISLGFDPKTKSKPIQPNLSKVSIISGSSVNVSHGNESLLTVAVQRYDSPKKPIDIEFLDYLLTLSVPTFGTDINYNTGSKVKIEGFEAKTPLSIAVVNRHYDLVNYLLKNKANPNLLISDFIGCVGHIAVRLREPNILKSLITNKLDYKNVRYPLDKKLGAMAGKNVKELAVYLNDCHNPYTACINLMK